MITRFQNWLLLTQILFIVTHRESTPNMGGATDTRKNEKVAQKDQKQQ